MSISVFSIRKNWTKNDARRDAGINVHPEEIIRFDNLAYGDDPMQVLDIYRPKNTEGLSPVIVSVHGGAFVYGTKETYQCYCLDLAKRGFTVINFSYRLAPENPFPDSIQDVFRAFDYVRKVETIYGLDLRNIFAVGDSAGASLLCMYCNAVTNPRCAKRLGLTITPKTILPKAIGLNCGLYSYDSFAHVNFFLRSSFQDLFDNMDNQVHYGPAFDIMKYMNENFPPVYLMMANRDFTTKSGRAFLEELKKANHLVESHLYGTFFRPLFHVFHLNMRSEEGRKANDEEISFFRRFIKKPKTVSW